MNQVYTNLARSWGTMGKSLLIWGTGLVLMLLLAGTVLAQSSDNYNLDSYLIAGSGGVVSSGSFVVDGTAGQSAASPPFPSSSNFVVRGGYWSSGVTALDYWIYLPQVIRDS
ncbi:hypothetical protein ACFLWA_02495 [Chloroflexota bacterium]